MRSTVRTLIKIVDHKITNKKSKTPKETNIDYWFKFSQHLFMNLIRKHELAEQQTIIF